MIKSTNEVIETVFKPYHPANIENDENSKYLWNNTKLANWNPKSSGNTWEGSTLKEVSCMGHFNPSICGMLEGDLPDKYILLRSHRAALCSMVQPSAVKASADM